jgi:hypothetical protein
MSLDLHVALHNPGENMSKLQFLAFTGGFFMLAIGIGFMVCHQSSSFPSNDLLIYSHGQLKSYATEVFTRLTQQRPAPAWEDQFVWQDQCDLNLMTNCEKVSEHKGAANAQFHLLHSLSSSPQETEVLPSKQSAESQPLFPEVLQSIYYNASAAKTITEHHLSNQGALDALLKQLVDAHVKLADQTIPDFGRDAMIIKTVWETVDAGGPDTSATLAVDDITQRVTSPTHPPALQNLINWPIQITVDATHPDTPCSINLQTKTYTLGCFHYRTITTQQLRAIRKQPGAQDIVQGFCSERCYLILVGVHIMTKATPNWVWMTFRWTNESQKASVRDKWDFFDGDATVNNQDLLANPYLEGPNGFGMKTNCMECHRHAVYNPACGSSVSGISGKPPNPPNSNLQEPAAYFQNSLQTHFLWTIALNQSATAPSECTYPASPLGGAQ